MTKCRLCAEDPRGDCGLHTQTVSPTAPLANTPAIESCQSCGKVYPEGYTLSRNEWGCVHTAPEVAITAATSDNLPMMDEDVERARRGEIAVDFARLLATIDALRRDLSTQAAETRRWIDESGRLCELNTRLKERAERAEADAEALRSRIGDAHTLLGDYGAGGAAAGLVPAIHNLAHRAEKAEADAKRMAGALIEALDSEYVPDGSVFRGRIDELLAAHAEAVRGRGEG